MKLHGRDRAVTLTERGRYIDLSPTALDSAIRLLDQAPAVKVFGVMLETAERRAENSPEQSTSARYALRWTTFAC